MKQTLKNVAWMLTGAAIGIVAFVALIAANDNANQFVGRIISQF